MTTLRETKANNIINKQIDSLNTTAGAQRALAKEDASVLAEMKATIERVTEKPIYSGFTFPSNIESIVAIAGALQYMKGDLREDIPSDYYTIFDDELRTNIIEAYGRLPYLAEPLLIEVAGEMVDIDPEAPTRAAEGIPANPDDLTVYTTIIANDLGLLSDMVATQTQATNAWAQAKTKLAKQQALSQYATDIAE